jgi:DDE domain
MQIDAGGASLAEVRTSAKGYRLATTVQGPATGKGAHFIIVDDGIVTPRWACCLTRGRITERMKKISYSGYRFPPEIIHQAIWLYLRFTLSLRDVEDLLAERGVAVSYETVRRWVNHFGPMIAADLRKRRLKPHTTWHLDEVYLKIDGRMVYLWRAVDAEGCWSSPSETSTPR